MTGIAPFETRPLGAPRDEEIMEMASRIPLILGCFAQRSLEGRTPPLRRS